MHLINILPWIQREEHRVISDDRYEVVLIGGPLQEGLDGEYSIYERCYEHQRIQTYYVYTPWYYDSYKVEGKRIV